MRTGLGLEAAFGQRIGQRLDIDAIGERVRLVLETRPGTLPWRPDFGCELDALVGQPLTAARLQEVRIAVQRAIESALPEVVVREIDLRLKTDLGAPTRERPRDLPIAEASLVPFGSGAGLDISLLLEGPGGTYSVGLSLDR